MADLRAGSLLGPVISLEIPGGVVIWAATSHAAAREVLQGDERLFAKHLSSWKAPPRKASPEVTAAALETRGPRLRALPAVLDPAVATGPMVGLTMSLTLTW